MSLAIRSLELFIKDLKKKQVPQELIEIKQRVMFECILTNKPLYQFATVQNLMDIITMSQEKQIVNYYKDKVTNQQKKLAL